MKKRIVSFSVLVLAISLIFCGSLSCYAAHITNVVSDDFTSASASNFICPGDINANKSLDAEDLASLVQYLLTDTSNKYCDVNGDETVNLLDYVRQKKNCAAGVFIQDSEMKLNGNSIFTGNFNSVLGTGASYKFSCKYKSSSAISVKLNGVNKTVVLPASGEYTTYEETFTTPFSISNTNDIEFQIIGTGTIDSISLVRQNMDNEHTINW